MKSMIQLVSQLVPPSGEKAWSQRAELGVMSVHWKRTLIGRPCSVSSPSKRPVPLAKPPRTGGSMRVGSRASSHQARTGEHERLPPAEGSGRPTDGGLHSPERFPCDPTRLLSLHGEQLLFFHPDEQPAFDVPHLTTHDPLGRDDGAGEDAVQDSVRGGEVLASMLLQHGLLEILLRDADVLA